MGTQAIVFDLDDTIWCAEALPDWDGVTVRQADALTDDFARLGLQHIVRDEFVRQQASV